jgi:amino acid adenylation domain-containing protein
MAANSIQEAFALQTARTPDAVAVSAGEVRLTYRELDERANRLAHRLLDLGVRTESPVAVLMQRSVDLVVAILAVTKTGGYYLPLHTAYPPDRIQWIMDQAGRPALLTDLATQGRGLPDAGPVLVVDEEPAGPDAGAAADPGVAGHPDRLAYVMFTSGSTGQPKGVAVTHRGVLNLAADSTWDGGRHARVLGVAPYAFGVSSYELWVPLLRGGHLVLAPPADLDVATLVRLIDAGQITGLHLTAGLFRVLAEEAPAGLAGVREVLTGGDVISPQAVGRVLAACPQTVVRAMYGQTEATAFIVSSPMTAPYRPGPTVPVGRPMDNVRAYVLDERLTPVPPGELGELYVAGPCLARGYFQRPDLTAEAFVADPFTADGQRMYRTGDLVRLTPDGLVDFVGRANDQVKIRGYRVELAELESVLAGHPGVVHVAVVAREAEPGDKRIVAYVVPAFADFTPAELRAHAARSLPEYMVPAAFVVLDALPLTPNGKVDRAALPVPDLAGTVAYRAPRTERQELLCGIFAEVLGVPQVGVDDSFFDLGGQSLQAMRLTSRIQAALGADVPIAALFDAPTVTDLDAYLDGDARGDETRRSA